MWVLLMVLGMLVLAGCVTTDRDIETARFRSGSPLSGDVGIVWLDNSGNFDPVLTSGVVPPHPYMRFHEHGWVTLQFTVTEDGEPVEFEVMDSEGAPYYAGNAIETIRFWRFRPAMANGSPKPCRGELTLHFWGRTVGSSGRSVLTTREEAARL